MAARFRNLVILAGVLAAITILCGCIAVNVGEAGYAGENLTVRVENAGAPSDAFIQVTVFRLSGFSQDEYLVVSRAVTLRTGPNTVFLPADLPTGNYKIYIYVIQEGARKTAVIRDIEV